MDSCTDVYNYTPVHNIFPGWKTEKYGGKYTGNEYKDENRYLRFISCGRVYESILKRRKFLHNFSILTPTLWKIF